MPQLELPFTKEEFSSAVGVNGGSMAAITDLGFANALLKALAVEQPEQYGALAEAMEARYARSRNDQQARNKRIGKRRTNV